MRGSAGVHAAHCCKWHGCKYGDLDCPVANGEVEQEYPCEDCSQVLEEARLRYEHLYENRIDTY